MSSSSKDLSKWESFKALDECIRNVLAVAHAMNVSPSLIYKWREQPCTEEDFTQSGTRNPLDRIEAIITAVEKLDPKLAYIPIIWLCARFRLTTPIKLPQIKTKADINKLLLEWTKEFGETCQLVSNALEDDEIDNSEYKKLHREFMEDMAAGMALLEAIKQKHENGK